MFHYFSGLGRLVMNDHHPTDDCLADFETACTYARAPWFAFMSVAMSYIHLGSERDAKPFLAEAIERRPDLTLESYRSAFQHPNFPAWYTYDLGALEKLTDLGLPRQ